METEGSIEVIDLDLNEEPTEDYRENMESVYTRIEERIIRLEAVTLRARQRHEWRLAAEAVNNEALGLNGDGEVVIVDDVPMEALSSVQEMGLNGLKRSDTHLLTLALELENEAREKRNSGEAFFDCNICLRKAKDPILTCCGHLYCWPCFYHLPDMGTEDTKECPACKGEVKHAAIIPIYGNSDKSLKRKINESGLKIPPRPQAHRIESLRQQRISRGSSASRIEEVLRGLRSFSTLSRNLSSALSSAERIVEDLEGMAHMYPSAEQRYRVVFDADTNSHIVVPVQSQNNDNDDEIDPALPSSSTSPAAPDATLPRRIHTQEHFTDVTIGTQRSSSEQRRHLQSIFRGRTEQLSRAQRSPEIDSLDLLPVRVVSAQSTLVDDNDGTVSWTTGAETSVIGLSSVSRRRADDSEASGSGTPEPRRRRLR